MSGFEAPASFAFCTGVTMASDQLAELRDVNPHLQNAVGPIITSLTASVLLRCNRMSQIDFAMGRLLSMQGHLRAAAVANLAYANGVAPVDPHAAEGLLTWAARTPWSLPAALEARSRRKPTTMRVTSSPPHLDSDFG